MIVCSITHEGKGHIFVLPADEYEIAAAAMQIAPSPSECLWIVPGTIDPKDD